MPRIWGLFGSLYVPAGRLAFICYLTLLLYDFSTFGVVIGLVMVVATFFNVFLYFNTGGASAESTYDYPIVCDLLRFHYSSEVFALPCINVFHRACIREWRATSSTCLVCKSAVDSGLN